MAPLENHRRKYDNAFSWIAWFRDRILAPLLVIICVGIWATYNKISDIANAQTNQQLQLSELKLRMIVLEEKYMTKMEILDYLKRVEMGLNIIILQAGYKIPQIKIVEDRK